MKKILLLALIVFFLSGTVCSAMSARPRKERILDDEQEKGSTKILDLGEPTPEEKSQMEREREYKQREESGFSDTVDDTMERMAGDDSRDSMEFHVQ